MIVVDGLNLAYWCGAPPSLRLPLALAAAVLEQGLALRMVFDASAPYQLAHEAQVYALLTRHPQVFVEAPSGKPADRVLLREAAAGGAMVISRDRYRDHRRRYRRLIDDPQRLFGGSVRQDRVIVAQLGVDAELPASAQLAWERLLPLLRD